MKSHNKLIIESIESHTVNYILFDAPVFYIESFLIFNISFICPETTNTVKKLIFRTYGKSASLDESMKICVQKMLDHEYWNSETEIYDAESKFINYSDSIDEVQILTPEPFYSMFKNLFDSKKWKISDKFIQ